MDLFSEVSITVVTEGEVKSDRVFLPHRSEREGGRGGGRREEVSLYHRCVSAQDSERSSSTKPERKDVSVRCSYIILFTL